MKYLTQICRVCSHPLKREKAYFRFLWNDNKKHFYDLYCSNPNCGIKCLREMNREEYEKFLEQEGNETD